MKISETIKHFIFLLLILGMTQSAKAFTHPGVPLTTTDLNRIKANLNTDPWKTCYAQLQTDSHAQLSYVEQGPLTTVGDTPSYSAWSSDMEAVDMLAEMWWFTGNTAYADKAVGIINSWAITQTSFTNSDLSEGDIIPRAVGGPDILRAYSGWTSTINTNVKNYFSNVLWLKSGLPGRLASANQGADQLMTGMGVAMFCDDSTKFAQALDAYRNDACGGEANSLPNGEVGDTGRDQGHAWGELYHLSWEAQAAWNQGVDLFGEKNNRLLAASEYYCQYNLGLTTAFTPYGTCYGYYTQGTTPSMTASMEMADIIYGAYVIRKGLSAPYTLQWINARNAETRYTFQYRNTGGAQPPAPPASPADPGPFTPPAVTSLTSVDLGTVGIAGSASYSGGTWTVKGSGADMWANTDNGQFAYLPLTGDGAIIAKITSQQNTNANCKAGVMIRESLAANSNCCAVWTEPDTNTGTEWFQRIAPTAGTYYQNHTGTSLSEWVKLVRTGTRIFGYHSEDGVIWVPISGIDLASGTVYVGLCVTSKDNTQTSTATFTNVGIGSGGALVNRATGGTASASSDNPPNETAAMAFDGSTGTKWYNFHTGAYSPTGWLQYQFTPAYTVVQYKLTSANDVPQRDPKNWQFQGSNDGTTWTTLDTQSNQTFAARYQTNTYNISNTTGYTYYRLNITANSGGSGYGLQLSELALMAY